MEPVGLVVSAIALLISDVTLWITLLRDHLRLLYTAPLPHPATLSGYCVVRWPG